MMCREYFWPCVFERATKYVIACLRCLEYDFNCSIHGFRIVERHFEIKLVITRTLR